MVNVVEFLHVVDILDRIASPAIVERALRAAGLSRKVLREHNGFLPYRLEMVVVEAVARAIGDHLLGARLAMQFSYSAYQAYARHVLGAPDLATALRQGKRAFALIQPGSEIVLSRQDGHLLVGRRAGLDTVVGHRHLDDGTVLVLLQMLRHFLGPDWRPDWIEATGRDRARDAGIEEMTDAPVRPGAAMPAVAVKLGDLAARNPMPPGPHDFVCHAELPALMRIAPPETTQDQVLQALSAKLTHGELSQEAVAEILGMGRRNLQRHLQIEGTSYREVRARFVEARARALLSESGLGIGRIARSLGYDEPKSFQRAFRKWTGMTPHAYRTRLGHR